MMCKSEYIMFTVLVIGAAVHNDKGEKLWNAMSGQRKKRELSHNIDYGNKYTQPWRFKEIKICVPKRMIDLD